MNKDRILWLICITPFLWMAYSFYGSFNDPYFGGRVESEIRSPNGNYVAKIVSSAITNSVVIEESGFLFLKSKSTVFWGDCDPKTFWESETKLIIQCDAFEASCVLEDIHPEVEVHFRATGSLKTKTVA